MPLYEIKLSFSPNETKELIQKLGLVFQKEVCDTDRYFDASPERPKTKLNIFNGKMRLDELVRENDLCIIKGQEILEPEEQQAFQKITPVVQIERRREIYKWPTQHIETAFVYIESGGPTVFFEVYSRKRQAVLEAKKYLETIGLRNFVAKTYDELFSKK